MNPKSIVIKERQPSVEEFVSLWQAVGWGHADAEMARNSIPQSRYAVVAELDGEAVGMGRIVGDGVMYFYIQDVAVHPEHQSRGIGKRIVEELLDYVRRSKLDSGIAFTGLFAAEGKEAFYESFGFKNHAPGMTGMFHVFEVK
ncbi:MULTISPECIES: GNAT family N-acetyltransferase [unclassified Paenibacillus]|uniref:GNAT family N-acetyltransferase n=1 Tax=Paenibacillus TaxID=44249 RepID=UPI00061E42A3|nr:MULTISPECIES: GNAT family N-acetyltransferase [unclassified Paenibacillus]KKC47122.1 GCN5 family acetyltransferase [Paenibacillus sp. D9]